MGTVDSLTPFFTVPKGDGDVRVVFDGTRSNLNRALWAPSFILPTISSLLRTTEAGTWMADIDIREMFTTSPLILLFSATVVSTFNHISRGSQPGKGGPDV